MRLYAAVVLVLSFSLSLTIAFSGRRRTDGRMNRQAGRQAGKQPGRPAGSQSDGRTADSQAVVFNFLPSCFSSFKRADPIRSRWFKFALNNNNNSNISYNFDMKRSNLRAGQPVIPG